MEGAKGNEQKPIILKYKGGRLKCSINPGKITELAQSSKVDKYGRIHFDVLVIPSSNGTTFKVYPEK